MSTEGRMYSGHTPESDLPLGIVTKVDKEFIYVWDLSMGTHEVRFPLASKPDIAPGTSVNYHLGQDKRGVQYQKDIYVNRSRKLTIRRFDAAYAERRGFSYSIKTTLVFPPPSYEPYSRILADVRTNHEKCSGVAFSPDFGKVGCFASSLKFEPEVVYDAYVCRMPNNTPPDLISSLGTLFIASAKDGLQENRSKREEVMSQAPWNQPDYLAGIGAVSNQLDRSFYEEDEQEEYEAEDYRSDQYHQRAMSSRTSSRAGPISKKGNEPTRPYPTRSTEKVRHRSLKGNEEDNLPVYQGIVVRLEEDYFIIWSYQHGTVCALHTRNNEFPPLGTWVNYCCEDIQMGNCPMEEEDRGVEKSAFRVTEIEPLRLSCSLESTVQVQAKVWISEDGSSYFNDSFILAEDELLGRILCPRDNFLLRTLKSGNVAEIYAVFIEDFLRPSKWYAVAVEKNKEVWSKLSHLPDRVEELALIAFDEWRNKGEDYKNAACNRRGTNDEENINRKINEGRRYGPPAGYNGYVRLSSRKISEVLGLVVEKEEENQVSVVFTIFGLARVQTVDFSIGTWLKTNIIEDDEENPGQTTASDVFPKKYQIYKCDKIRPPMSTRVINVGAAEKILLCGIVNRDVHGLLLNDYMGPIEDPKHYLDGVRDSSTGYLVEFGLAHRKSSKKLYFTLLKYHGVAIENHDWVPVELSFYDKALGRTMDDPHTILLDAHYNDDSHYSDREPEENEQMCSRQTSRQVSPSREPVSRSSNKSRHFRPGFGLDYAREEEEQEQTDSIYTCRSVPKGDMMISRFGQRRNTGESMLARTTRRCQIEPARAEERDEEVEEELPYILPASRPMSTLPSTSALERNSSRKFLNLYEQGEKVNLDSQIHLYRPVHTDSKKRSIGLVVRKFTNCALLFSLKTGLVLIKSSAFDNDQQFDFECSLGKWLGGVFVKVENASQLPYKYMCVHGIQPIQNGLLETRVINQFVQVLLPNITFDEETVTRCASDPTRLKVFSDLGHISVEASLYTKKELHNSTRSFWVVFTQEQHECLWKLKWPTVCEVNSHPSSEQFSEEDQEVYAALYSPSSKAQECMRGTRHYSFEDEEETGYYDCPSRLPEPSGHASPAVSETHEAVTSRPNRSPSPDLLSFEPVAAPVYPKEEPKQEIEKTAPVEVPTIKKPIHLSLAELALDELAEMGKKQRKVEEKKTTPEKAVIEEVKTAEGTAILLPWTKQWHEQHSRVKENRAAEVEHQGRNGAGSSKQKSQVEAKRSTTTQSSTSDSFMEVDSHGSLSMQCTTSRSVSSSNPSPDSDKLGTFSVKESSCSSHTPSSPSTALENKPVGGYDLVSDLTTTPQTDESWPSDFSGCFSSNGGVYQHNVIDLMHEEGLQDFIGRNGGVEPIIQYPTSSSSSSSECEEEDQAIGDSKFVARSPSTEGHESDWEGDELMAKEDNFRLIDFDSEVALEQVQKNKENISAPPNSHQLFGEDIFSPNASYSALLQDSSKFFETLMAAPRPGVDKGKLKGGNTDSYGLQKMTREDHLLKNELGWRHKLTSTYAHSPWQTNDTEAWLNTAVVTAFVVGLAYFYWTLQHFFNSFSSLPPSR